MAIGTSTQKNVYGDFIILCTFAFY